MVAPWMPRCGCYCYWRCRLSGRARTRHGVQRPEEEAGDEQQCSCRLMILRHHVGRLVSGKDVSCVLSVLLSFSLSELIL